MDFKINRKIIITLTIAFVMAGSFVIDSLNSNALLISFLEKTTEKAEACAWCGRVSPAMESHLNASARGAISCGNAARWVRVHGGGRRRVGGGGGAVGIPDPPPPPRCEGVKVPSICRGPWVNFYSCRCAEGGIWNR